MQSVFAHVCVMIPFPVFANSAVAAKLQNIIRLNAYSWLLSRVHTGDCVLIISVNPIQRLCLVCSEVRSEYDVVICARPDSEVSNVLRSPTAYRSADLGNSRQRRASRHAVSPQHLLGRPSRLFLSVPICLECRENQHRRPLALSRGQYAFRLDHLGGIAGSARTQRPWRGFCCAGSA